MKWSQNIWHNMANNKNNLKLVKKNTSKSAFQVAVENTDEVKNGFCAGKQAIKKTDHNKIDVSDNSRLQGSLDIDGQVIALYPEDSRWDYALSYSDKIYYLEIHSAETSEIDKVINKVKWLKWWLKNKAIKINVLPKADHPYIWVQSGRYAILPTAKEKMKLSMAGIVTTNLLRLK